MGFHRCIIKGEQRYKKTGSCACERKFMRQLPVSIFYKSNFKSFSLIHPFFRRGMAMSQDNTAGRTKQISTRPIQSIAVMAVFVPAAISFTHPVYTPICPTNPQVPIPEATAAPFIFNWNRQVAIGPVIAEAKIGGIQDLCLSYCPSGAWKFRYPGRIIRPICFL